MSSSEPILQEIQESAVDSSSDLGSLLRRCKILAARLASKPLEDWLIWESNGYPDDVELPPYRIWSMNLKGHFSGPFGSGIKNAPIPSTCIPEKLRDTVTKFHCRQSVAGLEDTLRQVGSENLHVTLGDLALVLGTEVYDGYNCIDVWGDFGSGFLVEVLNSVRNRVLDFALELWKEDPMLGTSMENAQTVDAGRVTQIFQTTIYGGSTNLIGTVQDSDFKIDVRVNDLPSLGGFLKDCGLADGDIEELEDALDSDPTPKNPQVYGPKVSEWISRMVEKAASGSWKVGLGAAGNLLAQAIGRYYGLTP